MWDKTQGRKKPKSDSAQGRLKGQVNFAICHLWTTEHSVLGGKLGTNTSEKFLIQTGFGLHYTTWTQYFIISVKAQLLIWSRQFDFSSPLHLKWGLSSSHCCEWPLTDRQISAMGYTWPGSCNVFSQAFRVNWFQWRV